MQMARRSKRKSNSNHLSSEGLNDDGYSRKLTRVRKMQQRGTHIIYCKYFSVQTAHALDPQPWAITNQWLVETGNKIGCSESVGCGLKTEKTRT